MAILRHIYYTVIKFLIISFLLFSYNANSNEAIILHLNPDNGFYESSSNLISNNKPIKGIGYIEYKITITELHSGWYELFVNSASWPTDFFIDDQLIGHFSFSKQRWLDGPKYKALNLYLMPGTHVMRFERLYHPGLPHIRSVKLRPSIDFSGKVSLTATSDKMVFRAGEPLTMHLMAEKQSIVNEINFDIKDAFTGELVTSFSHNISNGVGLYENNLSIPTNVEGVFNVDVNHAGVGQLARSFQYVVIDTKSKESSSATLSKQLVDRIDATQTLPDYTSSSNRVVTNRNIVGSYLESKKRGIYGNRNKPDFFSYKLNLPELGFYLIEVDYPDDAARAYTISLVESVANPHALDTGVVTGGNYAISNEIQTSRIYFHAREKQPRLLFLNWHSGKRIAIKEIRIYRVDENSQVLMREMSQSQRKFGVFYEEPMRFTAYFGANRTGSQWTEIYKTTKRWATWSNLIGQNLWLQSIANYQHVMWPTNLLSGYAPADENSFALLGPVSPFDMQKKDIVRLLLLMAEKYNISFVGELAIPASGYLKTAMDRRFSKAASDRVDGEKKPWLIVSADGKIGGKSPYQPYFNPIHTDVQKWIEDVVVEIVMRYKDSPNFDGLAVRLMSWSFASWQGFPSIHWGYGDYTINKFERDTGIKIPHNVKAPGRFKKRYKWLTKNHYKTWVDWRVTQVTEFYKKLYSRLQSARPDLKLYINTFGPDFSQSDWGKKGGWPARYRKLQKLGWHNLLRESGLDPLRFKDSSGIIFSNSFQYPAGIRSKRNIRGKAADKLGALQWQEAHNPKAIHLSAKLKDNGSVAAVRFGNAYMEYDFPVKWIGYDKIHWRKAKKIRIVGAINPPGRMALKKYAWALAEGNINFMTDGGLGYVLGDPSVLQSFMREYHSLPDIGMTKLGDSKNKDNVLWFGEKNFQGYIYIVNTSGKPSISLVQFDKSAELTRITTGKMLSTDENNVARILLQPFELIAFSVSSSNVKPVSNGTL